MTHNTVLRWLRALGVLAWRWLPASHSMACHSPTRAGFTRGHKALDPDSAPQPPGTLAGEVRRDIRGLLAEWGELRVRRALGHELKDVERQVLAEDDPGGA
jgi:hypothetical protein